MEKHSLNSENGIMKQKVKKKKMTMKMMMGKHQESSLFPLLLSALLTKSDTRPLIKKCLNKIFLSIPNSLSSPILSLIPATLNSSCSKIACKSAEIIGAASLVSFEMNEKIAMEDEIVKRLISMVGSSERGVSMAACNALLDLTTTFIGREQLLKHFALDNLILYFIQGPKSPAGKVSVVSNTLLFKEDEYLVLLLQGAIALINFCPVEMLKHIPMELTGNFVVYLKGIWVEVHERRLCNTSTTSESEGFFKSNISINTLAESIFRLSCDTCPENIDFGLAEKGILNFGEISTEDFICTIWESSPMLTKGSSDASRNWDAIFGPFRRYLHPKEKMPLVLPMVLKILISCPPIASDELNICQVLNAMKNDLGCPIIYDRDVRVLKTFEGREFHYFHEQFLSSQSKTHMLNNDEISRCEEALNDGYSIALRGLEFRFRSIAKIADELAFFFGQPSVGVNMYLTPPNSQGLARHSDDHCVFVCQLAGVKRWAVYTRPTSQLPRLYECFEGLPRGKGETEDECVEFLLKEGDMLYIPRGCPHEAQTNLDGDEFGGASGFSLHLTFAIEIEPPFEWEGFMHIALHSWSEKQKTSEHSFDDPVLHNISVKLLHVAIKLLGNHGSTFRKACLIGSVPTSPITRNFLHENQKLICKNLISKITESRFSDVMQHMETTAQKNEDPLENLSWMKHLSHDQEVERLNDFEITSQDIRYLFDLLIQQKDIVKAAFNQIKCKFCSEVKLEDVEQHYRVLLDKYRKVRKEYANGMLSLHCTVDNETTKS